METKKLRNDVANDRPISGELLEEYGELKKKFNVYYQQPKCDSVDYSIRFFQIYGKLYVWNTNEAEAYPATAEDEESLTEEDGYWE